MTATKPYVCKIGFDYDPKRLRFEPGEIVAGLPKRVQSELAESGVIQPADDTPQAAGEGDA